MSAQKIDAIYDMIQYLSMEDKKAMVDIVYKYDKTLIRQCSDGVRIPANKMSAELIDIIYNWLVLKNEKNK